MVSTAHQMPYDKGMTDILDTLKTLDETQGEQIERWFTRERALGAPFFYTSVDLRHSGLRLAPVDTNLYPAGFNNLSPAGMVRAARCVTRYMEDQHPDAKKILIIPENHTRNMGYLENLATLLALFERAGLEAQLGSLAAEPGQPITLEAPGGRMLVEYPLQRKGDTLMLEDGFTPDLIVMNNDMTSGAPDLLHELAQPLVPPVHMGWWQRRKSVHFAAYKQVSESFGKEFGIDPWLLAPDFHRCGIVDFKERTGLDTLARDIDRVLTRMRRKYAEYGVTDEPFVYVKADSGTYGMGIMTVRSPEDILELNKKERNKMQIIKEGTRNGDVIIQEGIPTIDLVNGKPAEPMIYMIDGIPVGGMYRVNGERDATGNLNAAGMEFTGMCDESEDECGKWHAVPNCHFRSFGIVAAMAAMAAAREDYVVGRDGAGI